MKTPSRNGVMPARSTPNSDRYGAVNDMATPSISVAAASGLKPGMCSRPKKREFFDTGGCEFRRSESARRGAHGRLRGGDERGVIDRSRGGVKGGGGVPKLTPHRTWGATYSTPYPPLSHTPPL